MAALEIGSRSFTKRVVSDNACNARVAIAQSEEYEEYYCVLHTFNLVIRDCFKEDVLSVSITSVKKKCKELARWVRKSGNVKPDVSKACKSVGIKPIFPINPNDTRWHSTHDNISSIVTLRPALLHLSNQQDAWREKVLYPNEYTLAEAMASLLKKVKICCKELEADKSATMQLVVSSIYNLTEHLVDVQRESKDECTTEFAWVQLKSI